MDHMAGIAGLEPTHTRVKVWCLTDLAISQQSCTCILYHNFDNLASFFASGFFLGAPSRIRTWDTRIRSPMLYPAELKALNRYFHTWYELFYGAGEGNRTLATSLEGWGSTTELHPQIGGEERIRTTESIANGFTVRPIWPTLEHPHVNI